MLRFYPPNPTLNDPNRPADTAIEWMMGLLLTFTPLAFGATQFWSQENFQLLIVVLGGLLLARLMLDPSRRVVWSWAYLMVAAFVLLTSAQLLVLPEQIIQFIS